MSGQFLEYTDTAALLMASQDKSSRQIVVIFN